jgi:hypothetical protein
MLLNFQQSVSRSGPLLFGKAIDVKRLWILPSLLTLWRPVYQWKGDRLPVVAKFPHERT